MVYEFSEISQEVKRAIGIKRNITGNTSSQMKNCITIILKKRLTTHTFSPFHFSSLIPCSRNSYFVIIGMVNMEARFLHRPT